MDRAPYRLGRDLYQFGRACTHHATGIHLHTPYNVLPPASPLTASLTTLVAAHSQPDHPAAAAAASTVSTWTHMRTVPPRVRTRTHPHTHTILASRASLPGYFRRRLLLRVGLVLLLSGCLDRAIIFHEAACDHLDVTLLPKWPLKTRYLPKPRT